MIDITQKSPTLRIATATAIVTAGSKNTISLIKDNKVPKGNVFEMAKTAGLFAVKKTAELIPDCHPMPIESSSINFDIEDLTIIINVIVKTIYKTGVEVEAMHGASVVALTIYDMLKPHDKEIEISCIKLVNKKGGKSNYKEEFNNRLTAAVLVSSDTVSKGKKEDTAGKAVIQKLEKLGIDIKEYKILPDEPEELRNTTMQYCENGLNMVIISGGTGLSKRDDTPEAIQPLIEKEVPGIMEAARSYGQNRTPYAMLSRGIAGMRKNTLIITIPGSTKGAEETIDALFPAILHIFKVQEYGFRHQE